MSNNTGNARFGWLGLALSIGALTAAALLIGWTWQRADQRLRGELLHRAQHAARAFDLEQILMLSGTLEDLDTPGYRRLELQLMLTRQLYPQSRFLYLMGQKADGSIFFHLDSEPPGSEDKSLPGQVYTEVTPPLQEAFASGAAVVEGPVTDAWGTWVSASVPLLDRHSGEVVAVFGMDEDASAWKQRVTQRIALPASLAALLALLVIAGCVFLRWRAGLPSARRHQRWLRNSEAGVAALLGVALAALIAWYAHDREAQSRLDLFERLAENKTVFISTQLYALEAHQLEGLARLFAASEFVNRQEFHLYAQSLVHNPLAQAWGWVPVVLEEERKDIETQARRDGLADFAIWEMDETGKPAAAGRRSYHYPVVYVEPLLGNHAALGYDYASEPERRTALEAAWQSGLITATDPIRLVQESEAQQGIIIFKSVAANNVPLRQTGFVTAALRVEAMLRAAISLSGAQLPPLHVDFYQLQTDGAPIFLASSAPQKIVEPRLPSGLHEHYSHIDLYSLIPIYAFGKTYAIAAYPNPLFKDLYPVQAGWAIFLYGVVFAGLLALLAGTLTNRQAAVEQQVIERTAELGESEHKYRRLAESTRAVLWEFDILQDCWVYVSPQVTELTGWQPEDWGNKQFWIDRLHPEDRQRAAHYSAGYIARGEEHDFEYRFLKPDGSYVWLRDVVRVEMSDGKPKMLRGFLIDITKEKRDEQAIRRQVRELSLLHVSATAGVEISDEDELIAAITRLIGDSFFSSDCGVFLYDETTGAVHPHASYRLDGRPWTYTIRLGEGVIGQVARDGQPRRIDDVSNEENHLAALPSTRSELAVPVKSGERVIAVINVEDPRVGFYSAEDERLLMTVAGQLATAIDRIRMRQATQLRLAELEAVNRVSSALRQVETAEEMLPRFLDEALAAVGASAGSIVLYDPSQGRLSSSASRGWFEAIEGTPLQPIEGIAGRVYSSGEAYLSREFKHDPLTREKARASVPPGWGGACVPIRSSLAIEGVLFAAVELPRQVGAHQASLLSILAEIAGNAIHRMRLHQQTLRHISNLQAMRAIDAAITTSLDLRATLSVLVKETVEQLKVDAADVVLYHPHSNELEYAAGAGFRIPLQKGITMRLGDGLVGKAAVERKHVSSDAMEMDDSIHWAATKKFHQQEGFVCHHAVPLLAKGQLKGVLEVYWRDTCNLDAEWMNLLEMIAGQAAIAIDNVSLYEDLQRSSTNLGLAYESTIEGWAGALELRDRETEGHTRRVAELTLRLGRALGMSEDDLVHLRRGALLHDIGKMSIPDSILLKPGALTEEEFVIVRQHPEAAYRLLSPIAYLRRALEIPYYHHERWDGSGYPKGLQGEQIPLAARLFAVVDVWDALCSDRPYRKAWSRQQALAYLQENSGVLFDPRVVDAFLLIESKSD